MTPFALGNPVIVPGGERTLAEVGEALAAPSRTWHGRRVALISDDPYRQVGGIVQAAMNGFELVPLPLARGSEEWQKRLLPMVHRLVTDGRGTVQETVGRLEAGVVGSGLGLFTSGTTGAPKLVHHSFESLNTYVEASHPSHRWLVTYLVGTYAWVQVIMLGMVLPSQALVFPLSLSSGDLVDAMARHRVTAVPGTPTLWRVLLATVPRSELAALPIQQITLGGERADQAILDQLRALFPAANITHIFATTETGPALSVSDGLAGFPVSHLQRPLMGGRVELQVRNGTLWIRSPFRHREAAEWIDTGDVVEVRDRRVHIVGRRGYETINVGGSKVPRQQLEDHVRQIPGVRWARVYAVPAKLVGHLAGLDVVVDPKVWPDREKAEAAISESCRRAFWEEAIPRIVRFHDEVPFTEVMKTALE